MSEAASRLQVTIFLSTFTLGILITVWKVGRDLLAEFRHLLLRLLAPYLAAGAAVTVLVVTLMATSGWPETKTLIGSQMFDYAFAAAAKLSTPGFWSETNLATLVTVYGFATAIASTLVVAGMIACISVPEGFQALSADEQRQIWYAQSDRMKLYLYLGAGTLALGVLFMRAWASYPAFIVEGDAFKDVRSAYAGVVNSYVSFAGLQFTVMFAVVAVPVMIRLAQRATDIASRIVRSDLSVKEPPSIDRFNLVVQRTKERQRLAITRDEVLQVLIPVLAPVLAGSIPGLAHLVM